METTLPGLARFFMLYSWICFTEAHRLPCCCCSSLPLEFVSLNKLLPKRKEECWGRCQPQSPPAPSWTSQKHYSAPKIFLRYTHIPTPTVAQDLFYNKQWLGDMNHPLIFFSATCTQGAPSFPYSCWNSCKLLSWQIFTLKSNLSVQVMVKF